MALHNHNTPKNKKKIIKMVELVLFSSRWVLIPVYFALFISLVIYALVDIQEFLHYIGKFGSLTKDTATLAFVEMIDLAMIAALGKMIITGGYNSFVSREHGYQNENIGSGLLKVKIATTIVGVVSISLLQKSLVVEGVS